VQNKIAEYKAEGIDLDEIGAKAEIGADFIEKAMTDEKTIDRILVEDRTLAQKIFTYIKDAIAILNAKRTRTKEEAEELVRLIKARRKYEEALTKVQKGEYEAGFYGEEGEIREHAIKQTVDGKKVVQIGAEVFDDMKPGEKKHKIVADYIKRHIGDVYTIIESGQKVYIGEDLPKEFTQSKSTKRMVSNKKTEQLNAKNQSIQNVGELIEIATNRRWEKNNKQKHSIDAKYGWYRYETRFALPNGQVYVADLLIRNDADGKKYLYDEISIKKDSSTLASTQNGSAIQADESALVGSNYLLSNDIIKQNQQNINRKNIKNYDSNGNGNVSNTNPTASKDIRYNTTRYDELVDEYGAMDKGMEPRVDIDVPKQTSEWDKTKSFTRTALEADTVDDDTKERIIEDLAGDISSGKFTYITESNESLQNKANERIARDGFDGAKETVLNKFKAGDQITAEDVATAEQLIVQASDKGDVFCV